VTTTNKKERGTTASAIIIVVSDEVLELPNNTDIWATINSADVSKGKLHRIESAILLFRDQQG